VHLIPPWFFGYGDFVYSNRAPDRLVRFPSRPFDGLCRIPLTIGWLEILEIFDYRGFASSVNPSREFPSDVLLTLPPLFMAAHGFLRRFVDVQEFLVRPPSLSGSLPSSAGSRLFPAQAVPSYFLSSVFFFFLLEGWVPFTDAGGAPPLFV